MNKILFKKRKRKKGVTSCTQDAWLHTQSSPKGLHDQRIRNEKEKEKNQ